MIEQRISSVNNPVLRGFLEEIDAIRLDAHSLVDGLTHDQVNWRPTERRWSIGQCLDHITRTVRLYPPRFDAMLAEARERKQRGERAYREGAFSRWMVSSMEPPPRLRVRTLRMVEPPPRLEPDAVIADFEEAHAVLAGYIERADSVSLRHARTPSPFLKLLKFTLGQTFAMNLAHTRRHLWQARQVRKEPGFPV